MKFSYSLLSGVTALFAAIPAMAQLPQHAADFGFSDGEVEAAYTSVSPDGLVRSYVTNAQLMPRREIKLSDSSCRNGPDNAGHCIKVAGGGAFGEVKEVRYYWRMSGKGHDSPWEPCTRGSGCRAFNQQVFKDGRTVATFLISHVDPDGSRDLRMDVVFNRLTPPPPPPKIPTEAVLYSHFENGPNKTGIHN